MIRVAALLDTHIVSGPARQLAALAPALRGQDIDLTLVLFHRGGRVPSPYPRVLQQAGIPFRILEERGPLDLGLIGQLRDVLAETGADIIETHGYKPTTLAYLLRRGGCPLPWLAFFHGATAENAKIRLYQLLDRRLMRNADHIVVMSAEQAKTYREPRPQVSVIYNAVIPLAEESGGLAAPVAIARRGAGPHIGVVGRLSPEKGVDVFLDACALLQRRGRAFSGLIVGDGPERGALERQAARLGLAPRVTFAGHHEDMRPIYGAIDLLVLPSRSEGLPNVLLEGLRADCAVVATAVGAVPEVLSVPEAGIMVRPGDPTALADAIEAGLASREDEGPRTARQQVAERFSLEHRVLAHHEIYRRLVGRTSNSGVETHG